jgi:serine/threonine protein kinase
MPIRALGSCDFFVSFMVQGQTTSSGGFLTAGAMVAGRYKIIRTLGAGGMASVYLAEDVILGETTVALKILKQSGTMADGTEERFLREVKLTHRINHENVVRTFDFGQEGSLRYYTMEYLSGKTLSALMKDGELSISTILRIALQICRGVAAIHAVGIIHRDLKPDNIMVVDSLRVKITDFGVARGDVSLLTGAAEQILGTIAYLAPETLIGEKVTQAVDYYAFGAILFELLTGHLPIEDNIPARLIMRKVEERPPDPRKYRADIPTWLAEAVVDLLNPNPQQRMKSIRVFLQNLAKHAPSVESSSAVGVGVFSNSSGKIEDKTDSKGDADSPDFVSSTVGVNISELPTWVFPRWPFLGLLSSVRPRQLSLRELIIAALFVCIVVALCLSTPGSFADRKNIDGLFALRGARIPSSDLVVVAIDEPSYLNLNVPMASAWPRNLHTKLIDRLVNSGAKRIVFDILFVNESGDPAADRAFAEALARIPTILGASVSFTQQATLNGAFLLEQVIRPAPMFESRAAGLGIVGLPQDDGRIYRFLTDKSELFPDGRPLAEVAAGLESSAQTPGPRDLINYYGPAPTVRKFSYHDVIADEQRIPSEAFRDKIVFVGLTLQSRTGPSQREAFTSPYDGQLFGTEIHATATSNLLKGDWIKRLPIQSDGLLVTCFAVISILLVTLFSGLAGVLVPCGFIALTLGAQLYLFNLGMFIPAITPILLGFLGGLILRVLIAPGIGFGQRRW